MLKWLKGLFKVSKTEPLVLTNPIKYEDEIKVKDRPEKPKPTKPQKISKKRGPKKTGITKTDLNKKNKEQLYSFAKAEFGVVIDISKRKDVLVKEILKLAKK